MKKGQVLERAKVLFEQSKIPLKELENSVFIEYYSLPFPYKAENVTSRTVSICGGKFQEM